MPEVPADNQTVLPDSQRARGQKLMIRTAVSRAVQMQSTKGGMGQVFLLSLGAAPWQIGLFTTLNRMCALAQILGLRIVVRTGKSRLASLGYLTITVPLGMLIGIALSQWSGSVAIYAAIVAYVGMSFAGAFGNTAWWPLLQDVTAGEPMGRFFARMRTWLRSVDLLVPLGAGYYVAQVAGRWKFAVPFMVGAVGAVLGAAFIRRVPERPLRATRPHVLLRMRLALRVKSVRAYLWLVGQGFFTISLVMPYFIVALRQWGMPDGFLVLLAAFAAVGNVAGLRLWARLVDAHGGRGALSLTILGMALLGLGWLALPGPYPPPGEGAGVVEQLLGVWPLMVWAAAFHLLWGFLQGGFLMGRTQFALDSVPQRFQANGFTIVTLAMGIGAGAGALLGGFVFNYLSKGQLTLLGFDGRVLYLAAAQMCMLLLWPAKMHLSGHAEQTPGRQYVAALWQHMLGRQERQ